jgi:hypothetical protein
MNDARKVRHSITAGWIALGLITAAMPIQAAWYLKSGAEPYPALTQPGFQKIYGGADGIYSGRSTSLSVILADGSIVLLKPKDLFSDSKNQALPTIELIEAHPDLDAQSREDLKVGLRKLVPGREISYLRIESQPVQYRVEDNRRYSLATPDTVVVDLRDRHEANP